MRETSLIRVNFVKCSPPTTLPQKPAPTVASHIPSRVTGIAGFFPNGRFGWQVHYTLYFQIVCPLLMPGRLIALAVLGGGKGLTSRGRHTLKDSDYCFPLSLIEALERKDFNLVPSAAGRGALTQGREEKKKGEQTTTADHQPSSVNSSAHLITSFPETPLLSLRESRG